MIINEIEHNNDIGYIALRRHKNIDFYLHYHKNLEIVFCYTGTIEINIDNKNILLDAGKFCIVLPNQTHSLHSLGETDCFVGVFSTNFVPNLYDEYKNLDCKNHLLEMNNAQKIVENIYQKQHDKYAISAILCDIFSHFTQNNSFFKRNNPNFELVKTIIEYLENNYANNPSLTHLAKKANYNSHYLSYVFSAYFGKSFTQMVNQFRLEAATKMLLYTDSPITEISINCGFNSIRNFNRQFLKTYGSTPRDYRKNNL